MKIYRSRSYIISPIVLIIIKEYLLDQVFNLSLLPLFPFFIFLLFILYYSCFTECIYRFLIKINDYLFCRQWFKFGKWILYTDLLLDVLDLLFLLTINDWISGLFLFQFFNLLFLLVSGCLYCISGIYFYFLDFFQFLNTYILINNPNFFCLVRKNHRIVFLFD